MQKTRDNKRRPKNKIEKNKKQKENTDINKRSKIIYTCIDIKAQSKVLFHLQSSSQNKSYQYRKIKTEKIYEHCLNQYT